ncbi:hypothetical protein OIU76_029640 [Salix suchowensis]|nr:hypothetical protein OIU76_029640 [Salix suchowensis]
MQSLHYLNHELTQILSHYQNKKTPYPSPPLFFIQTALSAHEFNAEKVQGFTKKDGKKQEKRRRRRRRTCTFLQSSKKHLQRWIRDKPRHVLGQDGGSQEPRSSYP